MPINIPTNLPAASQLQAENIFTMTHHRATTQDIRPLKIAIYNLMPDKIAAELQLLRLLSNTPLQVDIQLIGPERVSKNTPQSHLLAFYQPFSQVAQQKFDGLIITGAPVEALDFDQVDYWDELQHIMDWSTTHVTSTLHICWGALAGLYHHYGIEKYPLLAKASGVFLHQVQAPNHPLMRGFDQEFFAPHSRHAAPSTVQIMEHPALTILALSLQVGAHIVTSEKGRQVFVLGHMEYDPGTLAEEYQRDLQKDPATPLPVNYFPVDNPALAPISTWRAHGHLLFSNWLNYCVYQTTPYKI